MPPNRTLIYLRRTAHKNFSEGNNRMPGKLPSRNRNSPPRLSGLCLPPHKDCRYTYMQNPQSAALFRLRRKKVSSSPLRLSPYPLRCLKYRRRNRPHLHRRNPRNHYPNPRPVPPAVRQEAPPVPLSYVPLLLFACALPPPCASSNFLICAVSCFILAV